MEELQRFDVGTMGALAAIIQEPSAVAMTIEEEGEHARAEIDRDRWDNLIHYAWTAPVQRFDDNGFVAFTELQREQARLPVSAGGIGVYSAATHSAAAFLGRSVEALPLALRALSPQHRAWFREHQAQGLLTTPLLAHMREAIVALLEAGVQGGQIEDAGVPSQLQAWATAGPGGANPMAPALLDLWLPVLADDNGEQGPPIVLERGTKLQSVLSTLQGEVLLQEHRQRILSIPDDVAQTRLKHMARHASQSSTGAMAYLTAPMTTDPSRTLASGLFREAVRKSMGIERPVAPEMLCHFCNKTQTAEHARMCVNGSHNLRHNQMVAVIARGLTTDGGLQGVTTENPEPFVGSAVTGRMDITIAGEQLNLTPPPGQR
jgi:hypothetical protein